MRDALRERVYKAERMFDVRLPGENPPLTFAEAVRYIRKVEQSPWTKRVIGRRLPCVVVDRGDRWESAHVRGSRISLPTWARRPIVLLHELAHRYTVHSPAEQVHGWRFCRTFLQLVRHFEGVEAHDSLREQFRIHKVRYKIPRKGGPGNPDALRRWREQKAAAQPDKKEVLNE